MKHFRKIALVLSIVLISQNILGQGWTVNPPDYSSNGSITAIIVHGTSDITTGTLGVFVDGECRGFATGLLFGPTGKFVFTLTCYSNQLSGETLTFQYFDPSGSTYYNINETIPFAADMIIGDAMNPQVFHTLPLTYNVTGGGSYCQGGSGLPVGLDDSESGVTYTLYNNSSPQVPTISGTGSAISFGNQLAGTYTVTGTNSGGTVSMTGNAVIAAIITPSPTASVTQQPTCSVSTGTIVITAPTGGAYEYSIDGGTYQSGTTFSGVAVGNHTLTTRLVASPFCVSVPGSTLTVNAVPSLPPPPTASVTIQPTCAVPTGTIVVTAPIGATYQYNMDGGAYQNGVTFTGVSVGNHTLTTRLTASPACISGQGSALTVNAVPGLPAAPTASVTVQPTCAVPTGTIVISAPTGSAYEYNIDGGTYQSGVSFAGVSAGNHTLTTRLAASPTCISGPGGILIVNAAPGIPAAPTASVTFHPTCSVSTGTIVVSAPIGAAYEYNMDGGAYQSNVTFAGVSPGNHTLTTRVIASPTCVSGLSGILTVNSVPTIPSAPTASVTIQPTCSVPTGTIIVTAPVGAAYQYNIDGGTYQSGVTFTGVSVGIHTLTTRLTASPTCISGPSGSLTVNAVPGLPAAPTASVTVQPTCSVPTGTIVITAPTGAAYEYNMDGGTYQTSVTFAGVSAGNHTLTTRLTASPTCISGPGGILTVSSAPGIPSAPTASVTVQPTCAVPTGTIAVSAPIGSTYEYNIDGGPYQSNVIFTGVLTGNHSLSTRLIASPTCVSGPSSTLTVSAVPLVPAAPTATVTFHPTCSVLTGTIVITAPTGATYEYNMDGGTYQTSVTFAGVSAGNHTLTTRLIASPTCISVPGGTLTVNPVPVVPAAPTASVTVPPTCSVATGTIVITAPTGVAYEYSMDGGTYQSGTTFAGVTVGNHTFTTRLVSSPTCISVPSGLITVNTQPPTPVVPNQATAILTGANFNVTPVGGSIPAGTTYTWGVPSYTGGVTGGSAQPVPQLTISGTLSIPSGTGTAIYTVTPISGTCTGANFLLTVTVTSTCVPVDILTQPANASMCATVGNASLTVTTNGTGPFSYQWQYNNSGTWGAVTNGMPAGAIYSNSTTPTLNVSGITSTGSSQYRCFITNCGGGSNVTSGVATLTVNAPPLATLTSSDPDNIFCAGTSVTFTAGGGTTYIFRVAGVNVVQSNLLSTFTTNTLTTGQTVDVIVTNANGCSATSPVITNTVSSLPLPILTSSDADNSFCAGTSVTFTAGGGTTYTFRVAGVNVVQSNLLSTFTTNTLTTGQTVDVIVTNANGCSATSAAITNTVSPQPTANGGAGGNVCGLVFKFSGVPSIGLGTWTKTTGPGLAVFTPNANTANATVTVTEYGSYTFTWTEVSGACTSSSAVTVNFYLNTVAIAGTGGNNCGLGFHFNGSLNAGVGTWAKVGGPGNVTFNPDANTPNALVTVSAYGNYTFSWTVVNGSCSNSSNVNVAFIQQVPANGGTGGNECDTDFILGAVLPSNGTGTWTKFGGPGNAVFTPDNHTINAKVTVDKFGTYDFAWTVVNSTCTSSDVVRVVFHDLPAINAGRDTAMCKGGSVQLKATGTGTVLWSPPEKLNNPAVINPVASPDATTTYKVNLTDQFGCKNSDNMVVEVREKIVADAGPDQELGYVLNSTMGANLSYPYEKGFWSLISGSGDLADSTDANTSVENLSIGLNEFLWTVTNGYCPLAVDSANITVNDFVIPTMITPNMDGRNDYFVLRGLVTLGKAELVIFNRKGVRVYSNSNYDNSWDGVDYNKNPLPDDTYFYILKASNGKSISGYIVIRR